MTIAAPVADFAGRTFARPDPNSTSGICWTFGRYDRPWQERPIFGKIRYMTSDSTRRKLDLGDYLDRHDLDEEAAAAILGERPEAPDDGPETTDDGQQTTK